jgi:hypothetical protein
MRIRVRVDIIDDAEPEVGDALDLPCGEQLGGTVYDTQYADMDAVSWAELAGEVVMGMYKQARKIKPEICPAMFALRAADHAVAAIDVEDLMDIDPTGSVEREILPRALAHGESAAYTKE